MKDLKKEFENGDIVVQIENIEQSRFVIELAKGLGLPNEEAEPMFEEDTFKEYPYYFIEKGFQLQATKIDCDNLVIFSFNRVFTL